MRENTIAKLAFTTDSHLTENDPTMKTFFTHAVTGALCLISHKNSLAQIGATTFSSEVTNTHIIKLNTAKISDLTGTIINKKVLLNWNVVPNQIVNQFEVEKSSNGKDFVMAAIVFGTDKADLEKYMFHEKTKKNKTYYRVKIILNDGTSTYSPVISPVKYKLTPK